LEDVMQDHERILELLETASKVVGSDYKLAQVLEVSRQTVSDWKNGRKPCPPADVALMASVAGLDAEAWLVRATIEKYEGTAKGDRLYKALGKVLLATGAAVASSGANATVIFGNMVHNTLAGWLIAHSTMYRNVKLKCQKRRRPQRAFFFDCSRDKTLRTWSAEPARIEHPRIPI
jgi:hypothetical protein